MTTHPQTQTPPPSPPSDPGRCFHLFGGLLIVAAGAVMAGAGWQKWSNILTDIGHQFYVPWLLSEGGVLYKDVSYLYGPLSSYLHAIIFKTAGVSALNLALFNLAWVALTAWLIYALLNRYFSPWAAVIGGLAFVTVFALGHTSIFGNYNFIWPYVYDLTHGVAWSLAALFLFSRYLDRPGNAKLGGMGILLGCVALTKTEVALAAFTALLPAILYVTGRHTGLNRRFAMKGALLFLSLLLPPVLFTFYFSLNMPAYKAIEVMIRPWIHTFNPAVRETIFYQYLFGLTNLGDNLGKIALHTVVLTAVVLITVGLNHALNRARRNDMQTTAFASLALVLVFFAFTHRIPWLNMVPSLPLLVLVVIGYQAGRLIRFQREGRPDGHDLFILTFAVFSFVLMFKILFNVRVYHYGFALAMPGAMLMIGILTHTLPDRLAPPRGSTAFYKGVAVTALLFWILSLNHLSWLNYERKVLPVGKGADRIYDFAPNLLYVNGAPRIEGLITQYTVEYIENNLKPADQFVAFPEYDILNYLTRRKSPVPDTKYNPGTEMLLGEAGTLKRLQDRKPHYVVLVNKEFREFGMTSFGIHFGQDVHDWIMNHYTVVKQIGPQPFADKGFHIKILRRESPPGQSLAARPQ